MDDPGGLCGGNGTSSGITAIKHMGNYQWAHIINYGSYGNKFGFTCMNVFTNEQVCT